MIDWKRGYLQIQQKINPSDNQDIHSHSQLQICILSFLLQQGQMCTSIIQASRKQRIYCISRILLSETHRFRTAPCKNFYQLLISLKFQKNIKHIACTYYCRFRRLLSSGFNLGNDFVMPQSTILICLYVKPVK